MFKEKRLIFQTSNTTIDDIVEEEVSPIMQGINDSKEKAEKAELSQFKTPIEQLQQRATDIRNTLGSVTDASRSSVLEEELRRVNEQLFQSGEGLDVRQQGAQQQIQDTLAAQQARREEIQTAPGEAGDISRRATAGVRGQLEGGARDISTSLTPELIAQQERAGGKFVSSRISSDPQLANLRQTLRRLQTGEESIASTKEKISEGEFGALQQFFTDSEKEGKERAKSQTAQLTAMLTPEALAAIAASPETAELLLKSFPDSDISKAQVLGMALLQKQVNDLALKKTRTSEEEVKLQQSQADLQKTLASIDKPSALQEKINTINSLVTGEEGGLSREQADKAIEQSLGIEVVSPYERQLQKLDLDIKQTTNQQAKADLIKQRSDLDQLGIIYGDGKDNILNKLIVEPEGSIPVRPEGRSKEFAGQCSAFVNDTLGVEAGFFSSNWQSKIDKKNKDITQTPTPGDVFISKLGNDEIGHVGFIESVGINEKGETEVTIADSNRNSEKKFGRRTVTLEQLLKSEENGGEAVVGYYSPVNASRSGRNTGQTKKFTDSDKAILSSIDPKKVTSTTLTLLEDAGLSVNDLGTFLATEKKQLSPEKKEETQTALNTLKGILDHKGLDAAVGFGLQKTPLFGTAEFDEEGAVTRFASGSDAQDFKTEFDTFRSQLMVPLLSKLKGAMSDKDLKFLESSSTSLDLSKSQDSFKAVAKEMIKKMESVVSEGSTVELDLKTELPIEKITEINTVIDSLEAEGVTEEDIKASLINKGIDPSIFYNQAE